MTLQHQAHPVHRRLQRRTGCALTLTLTKGQAMPNVTHPIKAPAPSAQLLEQPSYARQVLIVMARLLEMGPKLAHTERARTDALDIATEAVLGTLPSPVRCAALGRARAALPVMDPWKPETRGEYAARARTAAEAV